MYVGPLANKKSYFVPHEIPMNEEKQTINKIFMFPCNDGLEVAIISDSNENCVNESVPRFFRCENGCILI